MAMRPSKCSFVAPPLPPELERKLRLLPSATKLGYLAFNYIYPMWHKVSFSIVAQKHIEYMKRLLGDLKVYEIDEKAFIGFTPHTKMTTFVHPAIYIMNEIKQKRLAVGSGSINEEYYRWWKSKFEQLIAVDVADSDHVSHVAIELVNLLDKLVVPSSFSKDAYERSGARVPVYVVPHGVDPEWYTTPNFWKSDYVTISGHISANIIDIYLYKKRTGKKILLYWLWHSDLRKGWPEVKAFYEKLRQRRSDVILLIKSGIPNPVQFQEVFDLGAINVYGWLSEAEKMALYDLADINIMFSRGGAFELNCLEAMARGIPCLAHKCCGWADYVPAFLAVRKGHRVKPLPGNHIHDGYGYTVDVEDAVSRAEDILDSYEEYKARLEEYRCTYLLSEYNWYATAIKLLKAVV